MLTQVHSLKYLCIREIAEQKVTAGKNSTINFASLPNELIHPIIDRCLMKHEVVVNLKNVHHVRFHSTMVFEIDHNTLFEEVIYQVWRRHQIHYQKNGDLLVGSENIDEYKTIAELGYKVGDKILLTARCVRNRNCEEKCEYKE